MNFLFLNPFKNSRETLKNSSDSNLSEPPELHSLRTMRQIEKSFSSNAFIWRCLFCVRPTSLGVCKATLFRKRVFIYQNVSVWNAAISAFSEQRRSFHRAHSSCSCRNPLAGHTEGIIHLRYYSMSFTAIMLQSIDGNRM